MTPSRKRATSVGERRARRARPGPSGKSTGIRPAASKARLAIIGGGNIGLALAQGLVASGLYRPQQITITRRQVVALAGMASQGFKIEADNRRAVRSSEIVVLAVLPQQIVSVLQEVASDFHSKHILISVVSGVSIEELRKRAGPKTTIVRAMPNTAIAIRQSMTCLSADGPSGEGLDVARRIFDAVGETLVIPEEHMTPATALCACGIAFFLRSIRAASQGGIEIGFHPHEALVMAAQTAKGAATLLLSGAHHPEAEIDRVTSPRGCTIAGLNRMEHEGFSSAMIQGITTSAQKAAALFVREET